MIAETPIDLDDVRDLERIIPQVENITAGEVDKITDDINRYQPLIISLIINNLKEFGHIPVFDDIVKNYLIIWMFFKAKGTIRNKKVTNEMFNDRMISISHFFNYLHESSSSEKNELSEADIFSMKHKMLMYRIIDRINNNHHLSALTTEQRVNLTVDNRCLIECLSAI